MKLRSLFGLFLILGVAFVLSSCSNSTAPVYTAEKLTVSQLNSTPGYSWFNQEMVAYSSLMDTTIVKQVKTAFDTSSYRCVVYVNPSCTCDGTQKLFPHAIEVMKAAGVPESNFEIYSMRTANDTQPYLSTMKPPSLPTIFILKKGAVVGLIIGEVQTVESAILALLKI